MAYFSVLRLLLAASFIVSSCARLVHRGPSLAHSHRAFRRDPSTSPNLVNRTLHWGDPNELVKRDGTKYVFMHHIVGNTYPYTGSDWESDIREIQAKGVDAIALNIGALDWQRSQVAAAYAAAQRLGSGFKLFLSFDFTEMGCDLGDLVGRVNAFANHPNQFRMNGKVFVSSYSGACLGNGGWASLKAQTNAYIMPFIPGLENQFGSWNSLDSWLCWGCAWPQGNNQKTIADDDYYINQLGARYAASVGPWMYTHYDYKNWYQKGDDWLINNRWEQLVAMRNKLVFVEMLTWNDFGESDYFGPIRGAQPAGTTWATSFPHTAWFDMSEYYIRAFKTGSYPAITKDVIYYWSKPHPTHAGASNDPLGKPSGWDWATDYLYTAVFSTSSAQVTLRMGGNSQTFNVGAGVSKLRIASAPGKITVQMARNGQTIIDKTPDDFTHVANPTKYNYNAYVGSATASGSSSPAPPPNPPPANPPPSNPPPSTTPTTPNTPIATSTSVAGSTWTFRGCYEDPGNARVLSDGYYASQSSNSISSCLSSCVSQGYEFGGVEYGKECWCSAKIRSGAVLKSEGECSMPCAGNGSERCGAGDRIAVYSRPTVTSPAPNPTTTSVSGSTWSYSGCYEDPTHNRVLANGFYSSQSSNSISSCLASCVSNGYEFGGVEYGKECWCSAKIRAGAVKKDGECNMACSGNASEKCGDGDRIAIYSRPPPTVVTPPAANPSTTSVAGSTWTYLGCHIDDVHQRTLFDGGSTVTSTNTISNCLTTCASRGFAFGGLEYGQECWCGTKIRSGVSTVDSSQCNMACTGNANEKCGAGERIGIYSRSTSSGATTISVTGFAPKGCVAEGTTGNRRSLTGRSFVRSDLTPQVCHSLCSSYKFSGVETGSECWCGDSTNNNGATGSIIPESNCPSTCTGDSSQKCGGSWTMHLSEKTTATWNVKGCYEDRVGARMLRGYYENSNSMTTEKCLGICLERGFSIAGTQFGIECFCGNELVQSGSVGSPSNAGDCDKPCSGDSTQNCGGASRNSLYTRA